MINNLQFDDLVCGTDQKHVVFIESNSCNTFIANGYFTRKLQQFVSYFAKMFVMDQVVIFQYTHIHYAHMSYKYLYY